MNASKYKQYDVAIIKKYQDGDSAIDIAKAVGCKIESVYYRLRINGVKVRSISDAMRLYSRTIEHQEAISRAKIEKGVAKGERNPAWKGGISDRWSKLRFSQEYINWRKSIFERDNYICQGCGYDKGNILQAHHILPKKSFPHLILSIDNGLTLCKKCHQKAHSKRTNFKLGELLENPTVKSGAISSRALMEIKEGSETMHPTRKG